MLRVRRSSPARERYQVTRRAKTPADAASRAALAAYLRERRARIQPADVGLSRPKAQRSPGLTRGQTARLASISSQWYTLIESGGAAGVSARCVAAIARALELNDEERARMHELIAMVYGTRAAGLRPKSE